MAELFSVELKFTIDTLKYWFSRLIKPNFFEIDSDKKQKFRKGKPFDKDSLCCICDFPIAVDGEKSWFDFVVECEYLFPGNIYSYEDLKQMKIENGENYEDIIHELIDFYPLFENALQEDDYDMCDEVANFLIKDLGRC